MPLMSNAARRRRMGLRLFALVAAVSLVLCGAVCALWVRSRARETMDSVGRHWARTSFTAISAGGKLVFIWSRARDPYHAPHSWYYQSERDVVAMDPAGGPPLGLAGVEYRYNVSPPRPGSGGGTMASLVVPDWLAAACCSVFPGWWMVRRIRRRFR